MRWIASILRGKSLWEVSSREPKILKRTAIINGSRDLLEFWQPVLCRISKIHDRPVSFPPVADQLTGLRIDDHHPLFDTCIPRSYASVFYVLRTFQFPIYFTSMPAIMKGWIDRVLAPGFGFNPATNSAYETGLFKGKSAMLAMTTGAPEGMYSESGAHGDLPSEGWEMVFRGWAVR